MNTTMSVRPYRVVVMLCTVGRGGIRTVVESYRDDGLFAQYGVQWIATHREGSSWQRMAATSSAYLSMCLLLLKGHVAAVHSHISMRGSFWRKAIFNSTARMFGVPTLAHLHGSEFKSFYAAQPPWRRRLIAREFERCRQVLVLSESWAEFVRSMAPKASVRILPNYVHIPERTDARSALRGDVNVLFLGLVGARKGVFDLIPAFAKALAVLPKLRLLIGGNGEVETARALARSVGIEDRVDFLGWVSGDQKAQALRAAHIYVLPSHNEGLPVSILEAMSYGLPVIATRVGGIPELVRAGLDGLIVDAGDIDALALAILSLAESPERRHTMGESAYERAVRLFSKDAVLPALRQVYDELLGIENGSKAVSRPTS